MPKATQKVRAKKPARKSRKSVPLPPPAPVTRAQADSIVSHALGESGLWHSTVWIPVIARLLGEALNGSDTDGAIFLSNCLNDEAKKLQERYEKAEGTYEDPEREKKPAKNGGAK
jgi:hypothetical protein